ncbi:hypothetical protein HK101_009708 [Irineochytrium annulatum]|nr:hypothetical protein HK101_009708 [Irineochytrium annulatum]
MTTAAASASSSFADLFSGAEDIFAGLDSVSVSTPAEDFVLSLNNSSARNSIESRPSLDVSTRRTAAQSTPTVNTSTAVTSASGANPESPHSSAQFPRYGSLSRTGSQVVNTNSPSSYNANTSAQSTGTARTTAAPASPPVPPPRSKNANAAAAPSAMTSSPRSQSTSNLAAVSHASQSQEASAPMSDDYTPTKKPVNSGQIINARAALFGETDYGEGTSTGGVEGDANGGASNRGSPGMVRSNPGTSSDASRRGSGNSTLERTGKGTSKESLFVRDASKALEFESLLTGKDTVRLSSTPDRLRSIEVPGKKAGALKYQAKAAVAQKSDNGLMDFLNTTGPEDAAKISRFAALPPLEVCNGSDFFLQRSAAEERFEVLLLKPSYDPGTVQVY